MMILIFTMNSLDFDKKPENCTIAVAMSGGVDSSTTAAILQKEGYKIIGITMKLFDGAKSDQAIEDAAKICKQLNCDHHVLDCSGNFKKLIIDRFVDSYSKGHTPLPCAHCNKHIKFGELLDFAKELGADCIVTGHYVQRIFNSDTKKFEIHKAIDPKKDQSYFLFELNQSQIDFSRFPLGLWTKEETREEALKLGLEVASKPDSQDICFVPESYVDVVKVHNPSSATKGYIVDTDGKILGTHNGIINYTIGQRRGLGIGGGHSQGNNPLFVIDIDAKNNTVVAGAYENLAKNKVYITDTNWLIDIPEEGLRAEVKLRSIQKMQTATIFKDYVILDTCSFGVAKDQACVAYIGDRMLGGGWITGSEKI